jgi:glycosyltransferase involved in cell wall biosynthesis
MAEILIINTSGLGVGGMTAHMINYIENINKKDIGAKFTIVVTGVRDENIISKFKELGCNIEYFPDRKSELIKYILALRKLIINHSYSVIHVHGNSSTMGIELFTGKHYGIPIRIAHCHNSKCEHKTLHKILNVEFKNSYTQAVACSDLAGEWIFGKGNYDVLPNAIDINKFRFHSSVRNEFRKKLELDKDEILIGHVGNFNEQKNHKFLIEIFNSFQEKNKSQLLLIGTGVLIEDIKRQVELLGIQSKIHFLGLRDDVNCWMQAMDVFVLPSKWEGFGMVAIEAQASNLPVVASTEVPTVTRVTNSIKYLDLNSCVNDWNRAIQELSEIERIQEVDYRVAKYDIDLNVQKVIELYGLKNRGMK